MPGPIIVCRNLTKTYPGTPAPAVHAVNLSVFPGEFVCFVGPSGGGKSTVLRLIAGLETPTSGEALYRGQPIRGVTLGVSMVFQSAALLPWLSVRDNVAFGLQMAGRSAAECRAAADRFIQMVGLQSAAERTPRELSGGMRQRAGLARALAMNPVVLLLDEPFSALDPETTQELHAQLLHIWQSMGMTMIMVSHLMEEALELADRVVVFETGRVHTELPVGLSRPRDVDAQEFMTLRHQLAGLMHR